MQEDAGGPEDKIITLTIRKMSRIENDAMAAVVGDEIYVADADGKEYGYRVFENLVDLTDPWVTKPVPERTSSRYRPAPSRITANAWVTRAELVREA